MAQHDHRFSQFLEQQHEEGMPLAAASDRVDLRPLGTASIRAASINAESTNTAPINTYLAHFNCTGLVRQNGEVFEQSDFVVGICFPDAYLSHFDTARVLSWCAPNEIWHPNIRMPFACAGNMQPGTSLVDLLFQIHEMITYQNVEMREHNALNKEACAWARNNTHRFPVDRRPLKRRLRTTGHRAISHGETSPESTLQQVR